MSAPRFYVTADTSDRTGRVCGYYVRYDAGAVFSYFKGQHGALANASKLRDEMNERERKKLPSDADFSRASHYS